MGGKGLFLFTPPYYFKQEAAMISEILGSLPFLTVHVRKPDGSVNDVARLLDQIPANLHCHLLVHYFPGLLESFQLKGWHYSPFRPAESATKALSRSVHTHLELAAYSTGYDYLFCSPVFDSISKPGYAAVPWNIQSLPEDTKSKAVALGGISQETIPVARQLGFHNFAVLGSVWSSDDPVAYAQQLSKQILTDEN